MPGIVSTIAIPATLQTDTVAIGNGASSRDVTFPVPFRSAPVVSPTVCKGNIADENLFLLNIAGVSETGFTAFFSAATTNGNYTLHYIATGI